MKRICYILILVIAAGMGQNILAQVTMPAVPDTATLRSAFSKKDLNAFAHPDRIYYPETWFHFLNGSIKLFFFLGRLFAAPQ